MRQVQKSAENISHEVQSLLNEDEKIRRSLEAYRDLLNEIDTSPYYHLFAAWEHHRIHKQITQSLLLIVRHLYGDEETADGISEASLEILKEDERIARAVSHHGQQNDGNRVSIPKVKKWLTRQKALHWGFYQLQDLAFASALLDRQMPPFEAGASGNKEKRNQEARRQVLSDYEGLDHPIKTRLETLRTEAKEGRMFTPQMLKVMVRDAVQNQLNQLVASKFSQFKTYREHFIQKAETGRKSFDDEGSNLTMKYAECVVAYEVTTGISIAPTKKEEETFRDALRATDVGAQYVWNRNMSLDGLREQLRDKRGRLLVKLYAWIQVHEAMEKSNDPQKAIEPARITESRGKSGWLADLRDVHELLLAYPTLKNAETEEDWKSRFLGMDLEKNFEGYRRQIERLAHSCFQTETKSEWADRYRRYHNFATLVRDLWDGSWIDHS